MTTHTPCSLVSTALPALAVTAAGPGRVTLVSETVMATLAGDAKAYAGPSRNEPG